MFKNRVSQSILLGFMAALLAFHCELAFSQSAVAHAPATSAQWTQLRSASFGVRTMVVASCRFVTGPVESTEALRRWIQAQSNGQSAARCGASQPLVMTGGVLRQAAVGAQVSSSGEHVITYGPGSPYEALASDSQLLISF